MNDMQQRWARIIRITIRALHRKQQAEATAKSSSPNQLQEVKR